jgi:hypothetical protein
MAFRTLFKFTFAVTVISILLVGCRAKPAPSAGFADNSKLQHDPSVPLNRFWRKPDVNWEQYTKIYIAEVNTSYLFKANGWEKGERGDAYKKDVEEMAVYQRISIMKAFREDKTHRFEVVAQPTGDPDTLVLEVALIQLVPSKVTLNLAEWAPFFVGDGITVVRFVADDKSCAAYEARMLDAHTGEVLMLAADREDEQYAIIDLRGLTWYGDIRGIMNDWSKQLVEISDNRPGTKIAASPVFRLSPW